MTHGTSDGPYTWCGDPVAMVKSWAKNPEEVECLDCLREKLNASEAKLAQVVEILANPDALDIRWETIQKALAAAKGEE